MSMKRFLTILIMATAFLCMSAKDLQTLEFSITPRITCKNCVAKIKNQLKFEKGIKSIDVSIENQKISLKFDAEKTNPEVLAASLAKIGYKATKTTETKE